MYKKFKNSIISSNSGLGLGLQMPYCTPLATLLLQIIPIFVCLLFLELPAS
jgi:hypothetical protein